MVKLVLQNTKNDSLAEQAQNCDIFTLDLLKNNNGTEVLSILFHFLFTPNISGKKKTLRTVPCGINGGKAVFRIIFKHFSDLKKKK